MSVVKILPIIIIVIERVLDGTFRSLKRCYFLAYIKSLTPSPPRSGRNPSGRNRVTAVTFQWVFTLLLNKLVT